MVLSFAITIAGSQAIALLERRKKKSYHFLLTFPLLLKPRFFVRPWYRTPATCARPLRWATEPHTRYCTYSPTHSLNRSHRQSRWPVVHYGSARKHNKVNHKKQAISEFPLSLSFKRKSKCEIFVMTISSNFNMNKNCKRTFGLYDFAALNYRSELKIL